MHSRQEVVQSVDKIKIHIQLRGTFMLNIVKWGKLDEC